MKDIRKPNYKQLTEAQLYSSKIFNDAVKSGCALRANLEDELKRRGVWSDDKSKELLEVTQKINDITKNLSKGNKGLYKKISEARKAAISVRQLRVQQLDLLTQMRKLDAYTAEGQAEQARFDCLVSLCVYDEEGNKVFNNVDDYLDKAGEEWARECAKKFSEILYGNEDTSLPEEKFLEKNKLVDESGRLINKEGKLVDEEFRLINQDGYLVNSEGDRVDINGETIEENFTDFEDDINAS